jgi:hypothetical protein
MCQIIQSFDRWYQTMINGCNKLELSVNSELLLLLAICHKHFSEIWNFVEKSARNVKWK